MRTCEFAVNHQSGGLQKKNTNKSLILSKIYAGFLTYWISAAVAFFSAASVVASLTEHCFH